MRQNDLHERMLIKERAEYWQALPTNAYRIRRLIRKLRSDGLEPGEREELELLVKRLAESGVALGFRHVADVASLLEERLWADRRGQNGHDDLEQICDKLDQHIDDMTLEALASGLRAFWND